MKRSKLLTGLLLAGTALPFASLPSQAGGLDVTPPAASDRLAQALPGEPPARIRPEGGPPGRGPGGEPGAPRSGREPAREQAQSDEEPGERRRPGRERAQSGEEPGERRRPGPRGEAGEPGRPRAAGPEGGVEPGARPPRGAERTDERRARPPGAAAEEAVPPRSRAEPIPPGPAEGPRRPGPPRSAGPSDLMPGPDERLPGRPGGPPPSGLERPGQGPALRRERAGPVEPEAPSRTPRPDAPEPRTGERAPVPGAPAVARPPGAPTAIPGAPATAPAVPPAPAGTAPPPEERQRRRDRPDRAEPQEQPGLQRPAEAVPAEGQPRMRPGAATAPREAVPPPPAAQQPPPQAPAVAVPRPSAVPPTAAPPAIAVPQAPPAAAVPPGAAQQRVAPALPSGAAVAPARPREADRFGPGVGAAQEVLIDTLRSLRRERVEEGGRRVIIEEPGNRTIVRENGRTYIEHDEIGRFRQSYGDADIRVERRGENEVTVVRRPNGVEIVSVRDPDGNLVRRVRREPGGYETILIDNELQGRPRRRTIVEETIELPPPEIRIPREKYVVEVERASPQDLEEAFTAPPVERLDRRYTLEEVRRSYALRERVRRVDVDTVTFDFGSWRLSEDQIGALTGVANAIGRALSRNPNEIFLIEGHTDAVGSDIDNLTLSDRRAETVATVLSERFGIPAENLTTQGYGEQYLKIATQGPERENRRVTIRRITPLLQQSASR